MRLIDADEAIEYLYEYLNKIENRYQNTDNEFWKTQYMITMDVIRMCMDYVRYTPTVNEWILCSEKMPKKDEQVFVYLYEDSPWIAWVNSEGKWETEEFTCDEDDEPTEWFSLPKPYKGDNK